VDGVLRAFNAKNGTLLWSTNLPDEGAFSSPPVAYNGTVYLPGAGESGRLYAVNEIDGSLRWEKPMQAGQNSSPAIGDNGIFLSFSCIYYKFDLKTGHPDWTVGQSCGGGGRTPVYADGRVWERDLFANYAIRASQTGRYLGTFDSDPAPAVYTDANNVTHQVAVINDVSTTSTNVATGAVEWTFTGDGEVDTAPLVINGNVVVGSATGMLYLLDGKTGATLWSENVGDPIGNPDESDLSQPLNGLGAGLGFLVVCSLSKVTVYAPHP
jgi:outer membrane protein assembly factor BamB